MPGLPGSAGAPADRAAPALQGGRVLYQRLRGQERRACERVGPGSRSGRSQDALRRKLRRGLPRRCGRGQHRPINQLSFYAAGADCALSMGILGRSSKTTVTPSEKFCVKISIMCR